MREVLRQAVVHDLVHTLTRSAMAVMSHLGFATINRARVQTLRSPMFQHLAKEPFTSKKEQKYGEKEERHQRHNLTVLSKLPVARSGAVG